MGAFWPHVYLLILILSIWGLEKLFPTAVQKVEETLLVLIITSIMFVAFGQVVARYGFNTGWAAALEFNTVAFSWLILLGMSYGLKTNLHLGVDIIVKKLPHGLAKMVSLFGAVCCLAYGLILLDSFWLEALGVNVRGGAIEYWAKMYKIGIGSEELHYPLWMQETFDLQPRLHRWVVLVILPVSLALLALRSVQAIIDILLNKRDMIISGHEAEDLVDENRDVLKDK